MKPLLPAAIASLALLSSCGESKIDLSLLEQQQSELKTQLEDSQRQVSKFRQVVADLRKLTDSALPTATVKVDPSDSPEVQALRAEMTAYRAKYKDFIRSKAPGMELPNFSLKGHQFGTVKVKAVDDTWFIFQHSGGVTRILMRDVDQGLRDQFACEKPQDPQPVQIVTVSAPDVAGATPGGLAGGAIGPSGPDAATGSGPTGIAVPSPLSISASQSQLNYASGSIGEGESVMGPNGQMIYVPPGGKMPKAGYTHDGLRIEMRDGKAHIMIGK
jgi:hypothetical protein